MPSPLAHDHYDHTHSLFCETNEKYEAYIVHHLDFLKEKCSKLTDCIDKLLAEESAIVVLRGENISLNKTCGLVYKPENGNYTTLRGKCSADEREEIRSSMEEGLSTNLDTNRTWKSVSRCLRASYGDGERTSRVEEICKLAKSKREICDSATHRTVETFFNTEIQDLQCKCKLLDTSSAHGGETSEDISKGAIIGIGIGCFVVLLAIFCIIFFCYRRKHQRKMKSKQAIANVVYKSAPGSDAVYQDIFDEDRYSDFATSSIVKPPALPSRYGPPKPLSVQDDSGYLEPMVPGMIYRPGPAPPGQESNPEYERPPRYSQYDKNSTAVMNSTEDGYFKPLRDLNLVVEAGDVSKDLAKKKSSGYEEIHGSHASLPLEDAPVPKNPVPAKRTKI